RRADPKDQWLGARRVLRAHRRVLVHLSPRHRLAARRSRRTELLVPSPAPAGGRAMTGHPTEPTDIPFNPTDRRAWEAMQECARRPVLSGGHPSYEPDDVRKEDDDDDDASR